MVTWECDISINSKNIETLTTKIKNRSYKIKGKILPNYKPRAITTNSYTLTVITPFGNFHRKHLIDALNTANATVISVIQVNSSRLEKTVDFLKEAGLETVGIYGGSIAVLFGAIFHANQYIPITENKMPHLITEFAWIDWAIMFALTGIPSGVHLIHHIIEYRKRYNTRPNDPSNYNNSP